MLIFKKYTIQDEHFKEVEEDCKNQIQCNFCDSFFFSLLNRNGKEFLECRCGNKISKDNVSFLREKESDKYQKLLESIDEVKENFLMKIRKENRNTSNERIAIFVDVQNIYYAAKDNFNSKIDFKKLLVNVLRGRDLRRAKAYLIDSSVDNKNFVSFLKQIGYDLVIKDLKVRSDGSSKGNSDIELTIDVLDESDRVDTIALVSGDGDFVPLVERLKTKNIDVEVYSFSTRKNSTAFDLKQVATRFYELDETYLFREQND